MTDLPDLLLPYVYRCERQWFWFREQCHFLVAEIVGVCARLFMLAGFETGVIARVLIGCILLDVIVSKEIFEDRVSQLRKKTFTDVLSWVLGYCIIAVWP